MILAAAMPAAACGTGNRTSLLISVEDAATGKPVAEARVSAETPARTHPLPWAYGFGATDPDRRQGTTDRLGRVRLEIPDARPVRVRASADGFQEAIGWIDQPWLGCSEFAVPSAGCGGVLTVRVEPVGEK